MSSQLCLRLRCISRIKSKADLSFPRYPFDSDNGANNNDAIHSTMATISGLESLPLELLTQISDYLNLYDLKRFRMVCKTTAESVFERMVSLLPKHFTVHGKRIESLMDLAHLGSTFKMGAAIDRLSVFHMKHEFSYLLADVRLPGLVYLRLANGKAQSEDAVIALLENHRASLRVLRMEQFNFVTDSETVMTEELHSWRKLAVRLSTGFQLRRCVFDEVGYCMADGKGQISLARIRRPRTLDPNCTSGGHPPFSCGPETDMHLSRYV